MIGEQQRIESDLAEILDGPSMKSPTSKRTTWDTQGEVEETPQSSKPDRTVQSTLIMAPVSCKCKVRG